VWGMWVSMAYSMYPLRYLDCRARAGARWRHDVSPMQAGRPRSHQDVYAVLSGWRTGLLMTRLSQYSFQAAGFCDARSGLGIPFPGTAYWSIPLHEPDRADVLFASLPQNP